MLKKVLLLLAVVVLLLPVTACESPGNVTQVTEKSPAGTFAAPANTAAEIGENLVHPDDFIYRGAFRLPDDAARPLAFAYGGGAMTFNPAGNPGGSAVDQPGSIFIMGHNRMPYGELPDGNQVAEINIPAPIIANSINALNQAEFLQPFHNVTAGFFTTLMEIPRAGMEYLDTPETGPLIHLAFGQHFQDDAQTDVASHAWFSPDLVAPNMQGAWYIGNQSPYSVNDYLFEIPSAWANEHTEGRLLATGRFRDGGWSGMGPALFAYRPWVDHAGTPAAPNTRLSETVLLLYENSRTTEHIVRALDGYQHPDDWRGGAWLTAAGDKSAVLFAGTKGVGSRYWYGFINPAGPEFACVEEAFLGEFTLCRLADGTPCPDESSAVCAEPASGRGWWSARFSARFILYNPADLAAVAAGELQPWEPQPYAYLDIDDRLYHNPSGVETFDLGTGVQRRFRIGDVAYDRENGYIYVLELFADEARPVVHVWQVEPSDATPPPPDPDPDPKEQKVLFVQNHSTGQVQAWVLDVDATNPENSKITSRPVIGSAPSPQADWRITAVHDIDGSGSPDLIWHNSATGQRRVWTMNGFDKALEWDYGAQDRPNLVIVDLHDMDDDSKPDAILQNALGGRFIWFMNGHIILEQLKFADANKNWNIVGTDDMDGNSKTNLIYEHNLVGGRNYWTLNNQYERIETESGPFYTTGPHWKIVAVHDLDGDGKPDILWENRQTGDRSMWLLDEFPPPDLETIRRGTFAQEPAAWFIVGAGTVN